MLRFINSGIISDNGVVKAVARNGVYFTSRYSSVASTVNYVVTIMVTIVNYSCSVS